MPRRDQLPFARKGSQSPTSAEIGQDSALPTETSIGQVGQLSKLALFIADGQVDMPVDLPNDQMETVTVLVRERRRENLRRHLARYIAADIFLNEDQSEGEINDRKKV